MTLEYNPADANPVWPEGMYDALLITVEDKISKADNPMQQWTFRVYGSDGVKSKLVDTYVVPPSSTWKIGALARAFAASDKFHAGEFQAENYLNQGLTVGLTIEKDSKGKYEDKNVIGKYLSNIAPTLARQGADNETVTPDPATANSDKVTDADIPF